MTSATKVDQAIGKSLLTGMLIGTLAKSQADPNSPFTLLDVRPLVDDDGNYLHRFEVDMPSGTYTIAVIDADLIEEEPDPLPVELLQPDPSITADTARYS